MGRLGLACRHLAALHTDTGNTELPSQTTLKHEAGGREIVLDTQSCNVMLEGY